MVYGQTAAEAARQTTSQGHRASLCTAYSVANFNQSIPILGTGSLANFILLKKLLVTYCRYKCQK